MSPRPLLHRRRERWDASKELFDRDDDESDYDSDYDDDNKVRPTPTRTTTRITTPTAAASLSSRPLQAGATNPADPNGSLTRISEDGVHTGARIGVAFGIIGGAAILISTIYFIWRRRRRGKRREERAPPALPLASKPDIHRTDTQILDELMATAYADQNGGIDGSRFSVVADEKRRTDISSLGATDHGVPFPYQQAKIRPSIASWLRRNHPLQLNALSRWSDSTASRTRSSAVPSSNRSTVISPSDSSPVPAIPVPPIPNTPAKPRFSERYKSVWSDTSAGTAESDRGSRGYASLLSVYRGSERTTIHPEKKRQSGAVI